MKQLFIKIQPIVFNYIGYIYDTETKKQEDIRVSSHYDDIINTALAYNIEEIILVGNPKYTTKIKEFILNSEKQVSTNFGYNINIKVTQQESK